MKHSPLTKPAGTVEVWHECETCDGSGRILEAYRNAGERYGGYQETCCDECEGDGGYFAEPVCDCCELPLTNGVCLPCLSVHGVKTLGEKRSQVWR